MFSRNKSADESKQLKMHKSVQTEKCKHENKTQVNFKKTFRTTICSGRFVSTDLYS